MKYHDGTVHRRASVTTDYLVHGYPLSGSSLAKNKEFFRHRFHGHTIPVSLFAYFSSLRDISRMARDLRDMVFRQATSFSRNTFFRLVPLRRRVNFFLLINLQLQ